MIRVRVWSTHNSTKGQGRNERPDSIVLPALPRKGDTLAVVADHHEQVSGVQFDFDHAEPPLLWLDCLKAT